MPFEIRPLTELFGAEIKGVDLSAPIADGDFERIRQAFYENSLLLFRDQHLDEWAHIDLTKRFGAVDPDLGSRAERQIRTRERGSLAGALFQPG